MIHARSDYNRIQDPAGLIAEDEPVFLLRAKDKLAPAILEAWARALEDAGGDKDMVNMAFDHAELMRSWQETNGSKVPDL